MTASMLTADELVALRYAAAVRVAAGTVPRTPWPPSDEPPLILAGGAVTRADVAPPAESTPALKARIEGLRARLQRTERYAVYEIVEQDIADAEAELARRLEAALANPRFVAPMPEHEVAASCEGERPGAPS